MKKTVKRAAVILFAFAAIAFFVYAIGVYSQKAIADNAVVAVKDLKTNYDKGETLVIPKTAGVEYEGKTLAAKNCYLLYPEGNAMTGRTFTLSETGRYTLVLEADYNGERISASATFTVNDDLYTIDNADSYVEYASLNSYFAKGGMNKGLSLHLTDGATFTYKEPINVYENSLADILRFNLMRKDNKVEYLTIRLTDCYDPSIALDITYWKVSMEEFVILTAGQKGYSALGLNEAKTDKGETGKYVIDGKQYNVGIFGTEVEGNRNRVDNQNLNNITLTLDTSDKAAIKIYESTDTEAHTKLVTQLNNEKLYSYKFPGFTNGNVFLSITASGLKNVKYADVEIGELAGRRNEELNRMGKFADVEPPIIEIEGDETDNRIYTGLYAKVPSAIARDASGIAKEIDYTVWNNYDGYPKTAISVTDGKFLPEKDGAYTVVYTAEDRYGNRAEKTFTLRTAGKKSTGIEVFTQSLGEIYAGDFVNLFDYTVDSLCKTQKVKVTLIYPDKTEKEITSDSVIIERAGEYVVRYDYEDAYYSGSKEYAFTVRSSEKPVFERAFVPVPARFIKNASYTAEEVAAFAYTESGKTAVGVKGYVSFDGGEYKEFARTNFTVTASRSVKIKYACEGNESVYIESETVPVAEVGYGTTRLAVADYFYGDFTNSADLRKIVYSSDKSGTAKLGFSGVTLLSAFSIDFAVAAENKISSLEIVFTDYYDTTKTASVKLFGTQGAYSYSIGNEKGTLLNSWKGAKTRLSYSDGAITIGSSSMKADFGFVSDLCLVQMIFEGVEEGFEFELYTFCGQTFTKNTTRDTVAPMISVKSPEKIRGLGDSYNTEIPCVADVLSPSPLINRTLTVYREGKVYTGEDGVKYEKVSASRSYEIKFTEYGTYLFIYEYSDGAGYTVDVRFNVLVIDNVPPIVKFVDVPNGTVKVKAGELVTPLEVSVSDNETAEEDISVWTIVYDEEGRLVAYVEKSVSDSSKYAFTLGKKGRYKAYVYCTDATGNYSYLTYEIEAE